MRNTSRTGLSCPQRLGPLSSGVTVTLLLLPKLMGPILDAGVWGPVPSHCAGSGSYWLLRPATGSLRGDPAGLESKFLPLWGPQKSFFPSLFYD